MAKGIFITGTDTGVGKTLIAGGLAAVMREKGVNVGVMKPVESGCSRKNGKLQPQDALFLREMADCQDELELVNLYALEHPLAPAMAAEIEQVEIKKAAILKTFKILQSRHEFIIVEGVGGLLVPLYDDYFVAHLVKDMDLPLLIVARASLGTINHTLLTSSYAQNEGLKVRGLVMNRTSAFTGEADALNPSAIKRWMEAPLLGVMPFIPDVSKTSIIEAVRNNLDTGLIFF